MIVTVKMRNKSGKLVKSFKYKEINQDKITKWLKSIGFDHTQYRMRVFFIEYEDKTKEIFASIEEYYGAGFLSTFKSKTELVKNERSAMIFLRKNIIGNKMKAAEFNEFATKYKYSSEYIGKKIDSEQYSMEDATENAIPGELNLDFITD